MQDEKIMIHHCIVCREAYKGDWEFPSLSEPFVVGERLTENLSHSSMNNERSATRGTSAPKHTVYLSRDTSKTACVGFWESVGVEKGIVAPNQPRKDIH